MAERNDKLVYLRVKIKSLMAESRIIRQETARAKKRKKIELVNELTDHRRVVVRSAARNTFLAYGYIRGRDYDKVETKNSDQSTLNWKEVARMVVKYGTIYFPSEEKLRATVEELKAWSSR